MLMWNRTQKLLSKKYKYNFLKVFFIIIRSGDGQSGLGEGEQRQRNGNICKSVNNKYKVLKSHHMWGIDGGAVCVCVVGTGFTR